MKTKNWRNEYETGDFVIEINGRDIYEVYAMGSLGVTIHNIRTGLNSDLTYDMADNLKLKRITKCKVINNFCEFSDIIGNCSQPSVSIKLKCHEKNKPNKEEILQEIKRHLTGIEKAIEKL
jgi:hypothetical protein